MRERAMTIAITGKPVHWLSRRGLPCGAKFPTSCTKQFTEVSCHECKEAFLNFHKEMRSALHSPGPIAQLEFSNESERMAFFDSDNADYW